MDPAADPLCAVNYGPQNLRIVWSMTAISIFVLVIRCGIAWASFKKLFMSDILMVLAVLLTIPGSIMVTIAVKHGLGALPACSPMTEAIQQSKYVTLSFPFCMFSACLARLSYGAYLLRFVSVPGQEVKFWILWVFMISSVLVQVVSIVTVFWACIPFNADGPYSLAGGCLPNAAIEGLVLGTSIFNAINDLILTTLTAYLVMSLTTELKVKIALFFTLGTSILAGASALARGIAFYNFRQALSLLITDFTPARRISLATTTRDTFLWNFLEILIVVVTASVPMLRVGYKRLQTQAPDSTYPIRPSSYSMGSRRGEYHPAGYETSIRKESKGYQNSLDLSA